MSDKKTHFHTFDALRFFSFLIVFLHHAPFEKPEIVSYFTKSGGIGVLFFFVLSGFLITYLLLYEKSIKGKISLKNFFIRRILRIWPLFYAMIIVAFLTPYILNIIHLNFSGNGYTPNWLVSCLFLENYKMMITGDTPNVSPLIVMWSLNIEEHFYILWGLLLYLIPVKKIPWLIVISILLANITRLIYSHFSINMLDLFSNFDFFAFGAIPAYLLLFKGEVLKKFNHIGQWERYLILILTIALVVVSPHSGLSNLITLPVFAFLFMILIIFTLTEKYRLYIPDNSPFSKLGIYTYGLYLIHTIIINLVIRISPLLPFHLNWLTGGFSALILTIICSMISYHLFEKQFLKLKHYFY